MFKIKIMKDRLVNFGVAKLAKDKEFGYNFGGTDYVPGFYSEEDAFPIFVEILRIIN